MELLDYQYADITVRSFAVNCMEVLRCALSHSMRCIVAKFKKTSLFLPSLPLLSSLHPISLSQ